MAKAKQVAASDVTDKQVSALAIKCQSAFTAACVLDTKAAQVEKLLEGITQKASNSRIKCAEVLLKHTKDVELAGKVAAVCFTKAGKKPDAVKSDVSRVKGIFTGLLDAKKAPMILGADAAGIGVNKVQLIATGKAVFRRGKYIRLSTSAGGSGGSNRKSPLETIATQVAIAATAAGIAKLSLEQWDVICANAAGGVPAWKKALLARS